MQIHQVPGPSNNVESVVGEPDELFFNKIISDR